MARPDLYRHRCTHKTFIDIYIDLDIDLEKKEEDAVQWKRWCHDTSMPRPDLYKHRRTHKTLIDIYIDLDIDLEKKEEDAVQWKLHFGGYLIERWYHEI